MKIAQHVKSSIVVDEEKLQLLKVLGIQEHFTTDPVNGVVFTVPFFQISKDFMEYESLKGPVIAIFPTAIYFGACSVYENFDNVFVVPYSDHSSYAELHKFVQQIKPSQIIPVVTSSRGPCATDISSRKNMSCFNQYTAGPGYCNTFDVPISVKHYMNRENNVCHKRSTPLYMKPGLKRRKIARGVVFHSPEKS